MSKKGLAFNFLMILIITLTIIVLYGHLGKSLGKGELQKKAIASREIALVIDTLYAYPYDTTIYYDNDLTGLIVEVSNDKVTVYDSAFRKILDPTRAEYNFIPTGSTKVDAKLENPKGIKFEKTNERLNIEKI